LLLWLERWYDASRTQQRDADDADLQLYRRFLAVLERDFARHHDAGHYADALRVPPAVLSRALSSVTGRGTKELVTDRVMLEAARPCDGVGMSVEPPSSAQRQAPELPQTLRLGAVDLTVADLDRAVAWYQAALGLRVHRHEALVAELGDGVETVVVLHEDAQA